MARSLPLALLLIATTAHAGPRQTREVGDPPVVAPDRARPPAESPAPTLGGDTWMEVEQETLATLEQLAAGYVDLVDSTPDSDVDEKADAYFRLADVYGRIARYWRLRTQELLIADQDADAAAAAFKKATTKAIKAFAKLAGNDAFKNYARMDRALFRYGYTLQQRGDGDAARRQYQRLIKEHPGSAFVADARIAFGDYYFEQAELEPDRRDAHLRNALGEYEAVTKLPNSSLATYALYRAAWVHVNLGEHQDALEAFYEVTVLTKGVADKKTLRRAAERDLVRAYAEVGKADKAHKYFQKVDKAYAFQMLELLAEVYAEQGMDPKTIYTFRALMQLAPDHADVCRWQHEVARATVSSGSHADKVTEIERLVAVYGAVEGRKGVDVAECRDAAAALSGDLARAYHSEWSKTREDAALGHALALYDVYLAAFRADDADGITEYYRADLLWAQAEAEPNPARWDAVAVAFGDVVTHGRVDAAHLEEAAYAAVLALDNAQLADPRAEVKQDDVDRAPKPVAIPDRERRLVEAIERYFTAVKLPKAAILVDLRFVEANVYRRHDHLDEAVPRLEWLVEHHRDTDQGAIAADLLLHSLDRLGRHDDMLGWVERLLGDDAFLDGKDALRARLHGLRQTARRKQAEACEADAAASNDDARYVACGEQYFAIFNDDADAADADAVLFNAAISFEHGKSLGTAIQLYEHLAAAFPKSKVTARAILRTGEAYARIAWYDKAADRFEVYAKTYAGEDDAHAAMNDAVLFRKGIGDDAKAIADTKFYVDTFAKQDRPAAAAAFYSVASIHEKAGDRDAEVEHLRDYVRRFGDDGGVDRRIAAYTRIGQLLWAQACKVKTVDGSCVKVTRERAVRGKRGRAAMPTRCGSDDKIALTVVARDAKLVKKALAAFGKAIAAYQDGGPGKAAYAQAVWHRAEVAYEQFLALAFPANLDFGSERLAEKSLARFDGWMADKLALGEQARKGYDAVLAIKDPAAAVAAAARMGQLQQHFSDALFSAPIPESVRTGAAAEDAVETYCDVLTAKAEPLELGSIDAFGFCLTTSTKLGWFSDWSRLCERELGQIRPEDYPTASELRAAPDQLALVTSVEAPVIRLR